MCGGVAEGGRCAELYGSSKVKVIKYSSHIDGGRSKHDLEAQMMNADQQFRLAVSIAITLLRELSRQCRF